MHLLSAAELTTFLEDKYLNVSSVMLLCRCCFIIVQMAGDAQHGLFERTKTSNAGEMYWKREERENILILNEILTLNAGNVNTFLKIINSTSML